MSWVNILVHLVFSTKNREPFLNSSKFRELTFRHIRNYCKLKQIHLLSVGGYSDHIHCLISLGRDQKISEISRLIKGESAFWINNNFSLKQRFIWQDDYWAESIHEGQMNKLKKYISLQEEHHKTHSFTDEENELIKFHTSIPSA